MLKFSLIFRIALIHEIDVDPHGLVGGHVERRSLDFGVAEEHPGLDLPGFALLPSSSLAQIQI